MSSTSVKNGNNLFPPGLVSNLQEALLRKKLGGEQSKDVSDDPKEPTSPSSDDKAENSLKPIVLVTNGDGIDAPGLTCLVEALVSNGLYDVHVCAPQS